MNKVVLKEEDVRDFLKVQIKGPPSLAIDWFCNYVPINPFYVSPPCSAAPCFLSSTLAQLVFYFPTIHCCTVFYLPHLAVLELVFYPWTRQCCGFTAAQIYTSHPHEDAAPPAVQEYNNPNTNGNKQRYKNSNTQIQEYKELRIFVEYSRATLMNL